MDHGIYSTHLESMYFQYVAAHWRSKNSSFSNVLWALSSTKTVHERLLYLRKFIFNISNCKLVKTTDTQQQARVVPKHTTITSHRVHTHSKNMSYTDAHNSVVRDKHTSVLVRKQENNQKLHWQYNKAHLYVHTTSRTTATDSVLAAASPINPPDWWPQIMGHHQPNKLR